MQPPFLSTHTPSRHLILAPRLPLASRLLTRLPPPSSAHEEFVECPQETLPWPRPHSSFNTGRKIKKKKKQLSVWRGEGSRVSQNWSLLPCLTKRLSDCPALSHYSHRNRMFMWRSVEDAETMHAHEGLLHAVTHTCLYTVLC